MRNAWRPLWALVVLAATSGLPARDLDVVINEALYHPPAGLDDAEFVELFNDGLEAVDVSGWRMTEGVTITIPGGTVIPSGGFLLLVKDASLASLLYPGVDRVGNFSGSLNNGGERLRLENSAGILIDEFDYSDDDGWPEEADGLGASLEKLSPEREPCFSDSWGSSLTLLGSPGMINTQYREVRELVYVAAGEDWKYAKGTAEPAGDWTSSAFDDAAWLVGPTGIGYGDEDDATILDDMPGLYSTVYLRKAFTVPDPSTVLTLTFAVDYDDAFILYLNGTEVARRNVAGTPGEPVPFDALATVGREAGSVEEVDLTPDLSLLAEGTNVLAIQVLNMTLTSTDLSMIPSVRADVEVIGSELSLSRLVPHSVVPASSIWSYFKGTAEPSAVPMDWTLPVFDDTTWLEGLAGFGFGDNDDATLLSDMQNNYTTVYVRRHFSISNASSTVEMKLGVNYDDGFIAYVNGVEVARANVLGTVGDPVPYDGVATTSHEAGSEETFDLQEHLGLLVDGDNVLAIQGFNRALSNGDSSLHPRLTVFEAVEGDPSALGAGVSVNEVYLPGGLAGWVELYNDGPDELDVSGYGLSDDALDPLKYTFPVSTTIPTGGFHVVSETDLGFTPPDDGTLLLTDPQGVILVDGRSYELPDPALPAGSYPDGDDDVRVLAAPTSGTPNVPPPARGVVINELMYHPLTLPPADESEWLELHNNTDLPLDLTGWALTRGVSYALPAGLVIPARGYLVVAGDPAAVEAKYGITGVIGGHDSGLRNDDEVVILRDELDNVVDRVHYADDGRWPAAADGTGPSAELIHPDLDNRTGHAWQASTGEGTPGALNSAFSTDAPPIVTRLKHFPPVPRDGQPVAVTAEVTALDPVAAVRLFHRVAGAPAFTEVLLADDGLSGDGAAGDSVYGVTLPGQPTGTVVELFLEAESLTGIVQLVPPTAPDQANLYLVDDSLDDLDAPTYRLVMTPADRVELETRDVNSNVLLNGTFITGNEIFYGVGVRYRGESSRLITPKSYRVEFTDDEEFQGIKHLNLNANKPQHQHLGMRLFRGADVPASLTRMVKLTFCGDAAFTCVRMEEIGEDYLRRYYSEPDGEDDGNLYRGIDTGNLDYRDADKESYRPSYKKETNEEEDDWSDLIDLCDMLTNTPDDQLAAVLPTVIDVDEWIRFFASHTLISTQEGGIYRDKGDDYFTYRRPSDGLFVLIPWDLDDSFRQPTERLFRPTLPQIRRVLEHPDFAPRYYSQLVQLAGSHFSLDWMADEMELLTGLIPEATLDNDFVFVQSRLDFVDVSTNQQFLVELGSETLLPPGAEWTYFRGTAEPSAGTLDWTTLSFDDSSWEVGPTGIGYGDNDDATVLDDMLNLYTTVYARHVFNVDDPSAFESLELAMDYDDGFLAFLNGVEVARANAGAAGTYPTFDAVASGLREAGAVQTFDIPGSALVAGPNVLAVVGLNATIDSTDFSLIPEIRTGGVVGEGCPGEMYLTGGTIYFSGLAPVTQTRYVRVNGDDAPYDRFTGEWSFQAPLAAGLQQVTVQALDPNLSVVATEVLDITRVHTLGGGISEDTTWLAINSPFLVTSSVTVAADAHLVIEPGCEFFIDEGVRFTIDGELRALGTAFEPILFTRIPCHEDWGLFSFRSRMNNLFQHCEFEESTSSPGCLTVRSSNLDIESCHIHHISGEGVNASGSTVNVLNTIVERTNEALSLDFGRTVVEFCLLRNVIGKSDLCDANGSNNPPARIAYNTMYGTSDDAIDADRGSVYAEGNVIRNCGDQGISLVGAGNSVVFRNVVFDNNIGLSSKDSHYVLVNFNTFAYNRSIGVRAIQKNSGQGGGIIDLKNSIVWGSPTSLFINSTGVITTTYSDVQGTEVVPGLGNINVDPLFVDVASDNYRLQSTSPCIGVAEGGDDMGAFPYEVAPRAPSDLVVAGTTVNSVSLAWTDNSAAEDGFELERRISVGFIPTYLVSTGDEWKFFRGTAEPSGGTLDWNKIVFDDSTWESGPSGIGYGDGDDATILSDMRNLYSTVYLRKTFDIVDPSAYTGLEFIMDYDDGFVAYLNGVEIARQGAGAEGYSPAFDEFASLDHEAGLPVTVEVPVSGLLVTGDNVLSVQGLNINITSSDLTLIPQLRTIDETPFHLLATLPTNTRAYLDEGLLATARYSYRVRTYNSEGTSAYSNVVSVETGTLPAAPTDLFVTEFDTSSITLSWTDNAELEETFELERAVDAGEFDLLTELPPDTTSYVDNALVEGEAYSYRVRTRNAFGASAYSNTVTQTTGLSPVAPTDLTVLSVTLDSIEMTWLDNADNETAYEVEVHIEGGTFQQRAVLAADSTSYLDADLQSGETYTYRVRAYNDVGPSDYSGEVSATTGSLPEAPSDLTIGNVELDSISLSWLDASDNENGFTVERQGPEDFDFVPIASLPEGISSYTDMGLDPGTDYLYRVFADNEWGPSPYSNTVSATTGRLPDAPSGLSVVSVGLEDITLAWIDNADNETSFELERDEEGAGFVKIADLLENTASYADAGLLQGTQYTYRLLAANSYGVSSYSEVAIATTARLPDSPSGLTLTFRGHDSVSFTWADNSDNETGFSIERSDAGGPFVEVAQISEDGTAFNDEELLQGTDYIYRVLALNEFGPSPPSEPLAVTTGRLPDAPSGLAATATWLDTIDLGWLDNSDNESSFEVERQSAEGGAFLKIADVPPDFTAWVDTPLEPGRTYAYRIRSVNEFGESEYSPATSETTPTLPADPTGLSVVSIGLDSVELAWADNADNDTAYELERLGPADADFILLASLPADSTGYVDVGLPSGSDYQYRVRAVGEYGNSLYAGPVAVTTGRLPAAPASLSVVSIGLDSVELAWADNADNDTAYELERLGPADADFILLASLPADSTGYVDVGLPSGTDYQYRVRAVGEYGNSLYAGPVAVTTGRLPAAPASLSVVSIGLDSVELAWADNADNDTAYELERLGPADADFILLASLPADSTGYVDVGLPSGTDYQYRVRAVGEYGNSPYAGPVAVTTGRLPAAPASLEVLSVDLDSIELGWDDNADNETGFELERQGPSDVEFTLLVELPADSTGYIDEGLDFGTTYSYRLRAIGEYGNSAYDGPAEGATWQPVPVVDSVSPDEGPTAGGTAVTILGGNFIPGTTVTLGGAEAGDIEIVSLTEIRCTTPPGARGAADLVITTPGGSLTVEEAYHYYDEYARGNSNGDAELDITDSVVVLAFLFQGGPPPVCNDVADANSDSTVDLSDAIYILNFLFLGGPPMEPAEARCY